MAERKRAFRRLNVSWYGTKRWLKYKYLLLFRAKGGAAKVAKGFSIGLAIEMFTLPTVGLAAVLILPFVYFFRASLPGALVGFVFGKLIYIPMAFLIKPVGGLLISKHFVHHIHFHPFWLARAIKSALDLIVGGMIVGTVLGIIAYFPVKLLLEMYATKRREKRRIRKAQMAGASRDK